MKTIDRLHWKAYQTSPDETHHTFAGKPVYTKRFLHVLKFHPPGLAPVLDETGAYHVDPLGEPIYPQRYTMTFGFYFGRAAVHHRGEWAHILSDGIDVYPNRYQWCGNFQEAVCAVKDALGFFHIDRAGAPLYPEKYPYVGDFRDQIAVVQGEDGLHFHINLSGKRVHPHRFLDLDMYHKGVARAKDSEGWVHIDRLGAPLYPERYVRIEPFYNGIARVETQWGEIRRIDERGKIVEIMRERINDPFHSVSKELVSYWRLFTLKVAQELALFDRLPNPLIAIVDGLALHPLMAEKLLLGLKEMGYVRESSGSWSLTSLGDFLTSTHPFSLKKAQILWMEEHFKSWEGLVESLGSGQCAFEKLSQNTWFDFLTQHPEKRRVYHEAISHYAKRDYRAFGEKIDCSKDQSIADVGGSTGALLEIVLDAFPHLEGHLLDLPTVLDQVKGPLREKVRRHPCDFFEKWPDLKVDVAVLCRVIHDWGESQALHILKKTRALLKSKKSRLFVIESCLDKKTGKGALLNLNMLVMTGGEERTVEALSALFKKADLSIESHLPLNEGASIFALNPLK